MVVDEWCFVRSPENRGVMEGGCEDLGEYPSDRNLLVLWDPGRRSWDHTSAMDEVQGELEGGNEAQQV